jgi:TetR/AcrR family transcriptional regulator, fatty acid metabolism regulator protein
VPSSTLTEAPTKGESRSFIEMARRAQVVAAAINAIADLGYPAASLARIAEYTGTSKGVLTYHFENKEDLVQAVVDDVLARAGEYIGTRIAGLLSAPQVLRAYIISHLNFFRDFRNEIVAVVEIYMNARDQSGRRLYDLDFNDASVAPLESLLRDGQARGEFGDFDAHMMALAIWGAIDVVPPRLARDKELDVDEYGEFLARFFESATRPGEQKTHKSRSRQTAVSPTRKEN